MMIFIVAACLLILLLAVIIFMLLGRKKVLPRKGFSAPSSLINLDEEELRTLGRIIGQAIAEELLKHDFISRQSPITYGNISREEPGMPSIDASIVDTGVSIGGIESKFDQLAEDDVSADKGLAASRSKLAKLKGKGGQE